MWPHIEIQKTIFSANCPKSSHRYQLWCHSKLPKIFGPLLQGNLYQRTFKDRPIWSHSSLASSSECSDFLLIFDWASKLCTYTKNFLTYLIIKSDCTYIKGLKWSEWKIKTTLFFSLKRKFDNLITTNCWQNSHKNRPHHRRRQKFPKKIGSDRWRQIYKKIQK